MTSLTIGMCAYNEEKNIGALLSQILGQKLSNLIEVLVVSSGSTDRTDTIVRGIAAKDKRIRLITEAERRGKVSAVNHVLAMAKGDIIALCGADLQLEDGSLEKLLQGFSDAHVGMIGARPVPTNSKDTFCGFCSHLVWHLHHRIALRSAKCGELVAFRNKGYSIPKGMNADEAWLEWRFRKDGWKVAYAPDAIVRNRGPATISDYIRQRRRIHAQHMRLKRETGYAVATSDAGLLFGGLIGSLSPNPRSLIYCGGAVFLEALSMALGAYDFHAGQDHAVWDVAESTKAVGP